MRLLKVPARQFVQKLLLVAANTVEYLPSAHAMHVPGDEAPTVEDQKPALQFWQLSLDGLISSVAKVPAGQEVQTSMVVAPTTVE